MKSNHLAIRNFLRKPARSVALIALSAFLCFAVLGGSLVITGLQSGLDSLDARLGADIMVVPYEATTKSQLTGMIMQGNPGYFYMSRERADKIASVEGIGQISEQFYLASASAGCCSVAVQIIGFDPDTDFTVLPWARKDFKGDLGYLEILVGYNLNAFPGDELEFYGTTCKVAGKLEQTGTYLDNSVYATEETVKTLISAAKEKEIYDFGDVDPDEIVSCVLINVADGYTIEDVVNDINLHVRKVVAIQTKSLISQVSVGIQGISGVIGALIVVIWALALLILSFAFAMIANERRKEFAILRVIGASRKKLAGLLWRETFMICAIGGIIGAAAASAAVYSFSGMIEEAVDMPFLLPDIGGLAVAFAASVLVSVLAGSIASAVSAYRISRVDTAFILRGEN